MTRVAIYIKPIEERWPLLASLIGWSVLAIAIVVTVCVQGVSFPDRDIIGWFPKSRAIFYTTGINPVSSGAF